MPLISNVITRGGLHLHFVRRMTLPNHLGAKLKKFLSNLAMPTTDEIEAKIIQQADIVKKAKQAKMSKEELEPLIQTLLSLKAQLKDEQAKVKPFDRAALEALLTKRFFYAPSFQIYGGIAGLYDYGPPGCAIQTNILNLWRQHFVLEEDMLEVECTNLTPEAVFQASGHVEKFADYKVTDSVTGDIYRADHLVKEVLGKRLEEDRNLKLGLQSDAKKPKGQKPAEPLTEETKAHYEMVLETVLYF